MASPTCHFYGSGKKDVFNHKKSGDLASNIPSDIPSDASVCETYTVRLQPQHNLKMVGVGASGQVYDVDDQVVLKTCRIFVPPDSDAFQSECWHYASDTLFHFNLLKDERTVLRLLQNRPHPHIIEATDTDQPEGVISPQVSASVCRYNL